MANSFVRYVGNGSTDAFAVPFSYRAQGDVAVTVDGVAVTAYTWNGAGTVITFTTAPLNLTNIEIRRTTSQTTRLVDYEDGSVLTENTLDTDSNQAFFMGQEAVDDAADKVTLDLTTFQWNAGSKRITNVANPTGNQDAATKYYLENTWLSTSDKANITTLAGISGNITTVAGISSDVTAVAADATDIGAVAAKATEIGRLGTADAVSDLNTLATSAIVTDMDLLATSGNVTAMGLLGNATTVTNMGLLGTAGVVTDLGLLGTSAVVTDLDAVADKVTEIGRLGTADAVADLAILGTSAIVTDLDLLGTSAVVTDMDLLATSGNVTNMATLGASGVVANIATVAGQITPTNNIATVAGISADITAVAGIASDIADVQDKLAEIETAADDLNEATSEIDTVANAIANVDLVGGGITNVNTVAGQISPTNNISTVAGANASITAVAGQISPTNNVSTLAGLNTEITALGAKTTEIGLLGVSGVVTNIGLLGTSAVVTDMGLLGTSANVTNMNTCATNIDDVNNFVDQYKIAATAPSGPSEGDLWCDTTANVLKVHNGTTFVAVTSATSGITDVVDDTSPSLGGDLELNGNSIDFPTTPNISDCLDEDTMSSDSATKLATQQSIKAYVDAQSHLSLIDEDNFATDSATRPPSQQSVKAYVDGQTHLSLIDEDNMATDSATRPPSQQSVKAYADTKLANVSEDTSPQLGGDLDVQTNDIVSTSDRPITITPNGSGDVIIDGLKYPQADGTGGYFLKTNGSGQLSWASAVETKPTITSLTPAVITNEASNVVIAGTGFSAIPRVHAIDTATGIWYEANSVTYTSATSITANFTLTVDSDNYRVRVENPDGNAVISAADALNVSDVPAWTTAAGSIGAIAGDFSGTVATVAATGTGVEFTETTSVLTNASSANCALSTAGVITTSDFGGSSTTATLYTFTIRATDDEGQIADRVFTLQSSFGATGGGQFN